MNDFKKTKKIETSKGEFGFCKYNGKRCFYKIVDNVSIEIKRYKMLSNYYKVPKLIDSFDNVIIYELIDSLINCTIHEYLYNINTNFDINNILKQYKRNMKSIYLISEDKLINKKFYVDRVNYLEKYLNDKIFNNIYIYNYKEYDIYKILNKTIDNISLDKELYSFITNGDPTDTNISIDGYFSDYECAGFNSIVGEIAIFVISILSHGSYFYPKYNKNVYTFRSLILKEYNKFKIVINRRNNKIDGKIRIPFKNKKLILDYLEFYNDILNEDIKENVNKYLKYYLIMRTLTPINVLEMDESDINTIVFLVIIFSEINSINELIELVRECELL